MDYITFGDEVYLVEGKVRACLYDLKKGELYSISREVREFFKKIIFTDTPVVLNKDELEFVNHLLKLELLNKSSSKSIIPKIDKLKQAYPLSFAWIEVTKACNLACSFCYENSSANSVGTMGLADFIKVKQELAKIGIEKIQFIGGEPLLLGNMLKKMVELSRDTFTSIEIYTNGTLINQEWCDFFKKYQVKIALSIHSYLTKEHDKVTKHNGSHKKSLAAVEMLNKAGIPYRVAAVRTKDCRIGNKPKISLYKLYPDFVRLTGRGKLKQYNFEMFKRKAITKETMCRVLKKDVIIRNISGHKCFLKNLYINTNLDVFPCVMERRFCHGNIRQNELTKIIDENIRTLSKDKINGCMDCEYRYACFDCRPDCNGMDEYAKPWYCSYDPLTGTWQNLKKMFMEITDANFVSKKNV